MILMLLVALTGIISACGFMLVGLISRVDALEEKVSDLAVELEMLKRGGEPNSEK